MSSCRLPARRPLHPHAHWCALQVVADYNADPNVHGILVQLPLPKHIDEQRVLDAISIEKVGGGLGCP